MSNLESKAEIGDWSKLEDEVRTQEAAEHLKALKGAEILSFPKLKEGWVGALHDFLDWCKQIIGQ